MPGLKDLHILFAEDDLDDGELVYDSFTRHPDFAKVTWVKNGKELLAFLENEKENEPDIILTDINMPLLNGFEAIEIIYNDPDHNHIPTFVYSSAKNPAYESKCKEMGVLAYFIKPHSLSGLAEIPGKLLYVLKKSLGTH